MHQAARKGATRGENAVSSFRFVHTADIHIDSPLRGLGGQDGAAADRIRGATRDAFENLISAAIDEEVAFVIIAGDLYDGDWRDYHTGLFFVEQMGRLKKAEIAAFVLYGNHDSESQITRRLTLPENVTVFPHSKPATFELEQLQVALHGQSFRQRDVSEDLVPGYPEPLTGVFNIGVLHTGLGGASEHANYAPCNLDELTAKGYDYGALGHVHQRTVLGEHPFIVFPGNLQGRHIRECGPKSASLVTVEDGEVADIAPLYADTVRWSVVHVDATGCERITDVWERVRLAVEEAAAASDGRLAVLRLVIEGRTPVHHELLISQEVALAEARAFAAGLGEEVAWVERVVVSTMPPKGHLANVAREDAIGELQAMLADASRDQELLQRLQADVGQLLNKLPHEIRSTTDDAVLKQAISDDYDSMIALLSDYLLARITEDVG